MREFRNYIVRSAKGKDSAFAKWTAGLERSGLRLSQRLSKTSREIHAPIDHDLKPLLDDAVAAGTIHPEWWIEKIVQEWTQEEQATAPFFRPIHTGHEIEFKVGRDGVAGVGHLFDVDASHVCSTCGAGARQAGPIRLAASELNKCGKIGSIWLPSNTVWLIADSLRTEIEQACNVELACREVEPAGKAKPKERWWQLSPMQRIPAAWVIDHHARRSCCDQCGELSLEADEIPGSYPTIAHAANVDELPPIVGSHDIEGEFTTAKSGTILGFPAPNLWLRADVAHALRAAKVRGLDLIPIPFEPQ